MLFDECNELEFYDLEFYDLEFYELDMRCSNFGSAFRPAFGI